MCDNNFNELFIKSDYSNSNFIIIVTSLLLKSNGDGVTRNSLLSIPGFKVSPYVKTER